MAMAGVGKRVEIRDEDRLELERIVRAVSSEVRMVERARIVLCAAEGHTAAGIAQRVGFGERTAKKWRGHGIQAKAPTKPDIPPAPGKPARREHEYKRTGTQCLFAALKVHHCAACATCRRTMRL